MGKFTNAAGLAHSAFHNRKPPSTQFAPFKELNGIDASKWTQSMDTHNGHYRCTGAVTVKDRSGNKYFAATSGSTFNTQHAESNLFDKIQYNYNKDHSKLFGKIIFYIHYSPCTECLKNVLPKIIEWVNSTRKSDTRVQFSFVFDQCYSRDTYEIDAEGTLSPLVGNFLWDSADAAVDAYEKFENSYGIVKFGNKTWREVTIRHRYETKGSGMFTSTQVDAPSIISNNNNAPKAKNIWSFANPITTKIADASKK